MRILVLKTNINNHKDEEQVRSLFDRHPSIYQWTVDREDCDKVLRIEAAEDLSYDHVITLVQQINYQCEELTY